MPFNRQAAFQEALDHLVHMASTPGWKAYAWHQAQELDAEQSGLYSGIASALRAAMLGRAKAAESVPHGPEKRP